MIYLSLLVLNPRSRQVKSELADPYEMHRTIAKAFGAAPGEFSSARCLFRVDDTGDDPPTVLVQSRTKPDWSALTADRNYLAVAPQVKSLDLSLSAGQRLSFRLLANPAVCREGKRHGLEMEEDQVAWLKRKGEQGGFGLLQVRVAEVGRTLAKRRTASFTRVRFDGILVINDLEAFQAAWEGGIGAAKGFGFGLLSLAPARV